MGLVQYESSDEDEEVQVPIASQHSQKPPVKQAPVSAVNEAEPTTAPTSLAPATAQHTLPLQPTTTPAPGPEAGPQLGPILGPARPPPSTTTTTTATLPSAQLEEGDPQQPEIDLAFLDSTQNEENDANPPLSPYTKTRTLLHNLTLPAHPNMDIPPSPPGTPPAGHDALTTKFTNFLQLKRTQGVHFNARLAASSGMRNPSVGDKLMGFVGFETEFSSLEGNDAEMGRDGGGEGIRRAVEQYCTVLSPDVWDGGVSFPPWAYKGPLRKTQERGARERERGPGEAVEFVKGGTVGGGGGRGAASRAGTPGLGSGAGKRKGRWDT